MEVFYSTNYILLVFAVFPLIYFTTFALLNINEEYSELNLMFGIKKVFSSFSLSMQYFFSSFISLFFSFLIQIFLIPKLIPSWFEVNDYSKLIPKPLSKLYLNIIILIFKFLFFEKRNLSLIMKKFFPTSNMMDPIIQESPFIKKNFKFLTKYLFFSHKSKQC